MIVGVDAGGSTCRLALERGGQRVTVTLGPCNVSSDFDAAVAVLLAGLDALIEKAGVSPQTLHDCPAWLAIAGVTGPGIAQDLRNALPLRHATVDEDRRAALVGALGHDDGCLAGIGTGSFLARQHAGAFSTLGGHGLVLGDEGSGAWLGREILASALRAQDGLAPMTPLHAELLRDMGGAGGIIAFASNATPAAFGEVSRRVTGSRDAAATELMRKGAAWISHGLKTLGWRDTDPICLLGGIAPSYRPWLPRPMQDALTPAKGSALDGAIALARRQTGAPAT